MYPSQDIPASSVILKILQCKLRKDQPGDLMELLSLALGEWIFFFAPVLLHFSL